ncbi:hypothetical protein SAMD00019534_012890 [Acytostelium subglobosum LB1]|uniref:hypothetical protein n=1 Tax=Acytostelium subglobosum LB1 TaxID=1410327 RepID=UPI000644A811|nr:hypothetical protein SAMD00019534_012890 [Acytostelium subglobosum LB1]GAM18114.1 hypothetical protein SAMD00019534_012890 [Acytostelium subglobosum LB1]|eukprot:XP_012758710.1 hypothetical protein SAMD00019534_012890 [Acytostelium subglobosum LB1]
MIFADANDKDSIEMMLADGLIKCLHNTCFSFYPSMDLVRQHILRKGGDHQCPDRHSCPGCLRSDILMTRQTLPNTIPTIKSLVCLHDGCSKEYELFGLLHQHCKTAHQCRSYASCLNEQRYRSKSFTAEDDDTESIKMLVAKGYTKCPHSECITYLKKRKTFNNHAKFCHPGDRSRLLSLWPPTKRKRSTVEDEDQYEEEDEDDEDEEEVDLDDEDVSPISTTLSTNQVPESNDKIKCLHSNCDKLFNARYIMMQHNRKEHQCTDHQNCPGCVFRRLWAPTIGDDPLSRFKCQHEACSSSQRSYRVLRGHCRSEHKCTWRYAACPNYQTHQKTAFFADPDDTESISMLTARGFLQCPHTSCGNFMATRKSRIHHLAKEHQCPDPVSCQGCIDRIQHRPRRSATGPNDNEQETGQYKCLHDDGDCTKSYITSAGMYLHCKKKHACNATYGACPNTREYRTQKHYATHDDTQSIERFLADGYLRCDHSECIYFFKTDGAKHMHMYQRHFCSDPHHCKACVERNFHIDNGHDNDNDDEEDIDNGGKRRLFVWQRKIISGMAVPGGSPKRNVTIRPTTTTTTKPSQVGVWNESMFNLIKCPHNGCEVHGQTMAINKHLLQKHTGCSSMSQQHCDGCQLSHHSDHHHWLLV